MIVIYNPTIEKYKQSAISAIHSGWISNHGEYIEKTTSMLKSIMNVKHCILMANGTCATHCLFIAIKYKYPKITRIYVPNNSYVASINCALMEYSKEQLCVMKMNIDTWNIDTSEEYIRSLESNSAMLIVHNLGNIINVERMKKIRPDIIFVEDNCEGLFGKYGNIYSGTSEHTLCSSVSFYGNKIITSGEGGAFFTNDDDVYNYIRRVYSQGMSNVRYLHEVHAYNYRMTNIEAAFIYDQLNDIDFILSSKRHIFNTYENLLKDAIEIGRIKFFKKEEETSQADWIFSLRIVGNKYSIEETMRFFNDRGVDIRPFFYPINHHHHLCDIEANDNVAELLNKEVILIPSSPTITIGEQMQVIKCVYDFIEIPFLESVQLPIQKCYEPTPSHRKIIRRNVMETGVFDEVDKNVVFELDNEYYSIIRDNVRDFTQSTLKKYEQKRILEIGPKRNTAERIHSNSNVIETVDIVENNTTYIADLTKENNMPKSVFDVIYCLEVLEHTYEPWELLHQIYKLLAPNGHLHLSVPFQFRIHGPLPDNYRISEYGLRHLLTKYGFDIVYFNAVVDSSRPAFPIHYTISCIKRVA